jgi:PAS domain S-box-containing protein
MSRWNTLTDRRARRLREGQLEKPMAPVHATATRSDQDISQLTAAFQTFSQSSRRLEEAYRLLQERVREIDRELIETNERLNRKVEELNSLTGYLNEILTSMHNGVAAVDRAGRITTFNHAAESVLGLRADDVIGQAHEEVLSNADGSPSPLAATLSTGEPCADVERDVVSRSGRCPRLSSSVAPIRDSRGALVGAVEIFSDLTEFRQLQERLDRADKLAALGQMAAQVAHEIRNPLNGIEGFATLLLRDLAEGDKCREFASRIRAGARSLNKIVGNMLLFCQPCTLQPRAVSVRDVVEGALAFVLEECRHRGRGAVEVQRDYDPAADSVEADPDQLRQAIMNLLLNAVQAMGESGHLRLATRARASGVEIRIQDSGPGIPQHLRGKVLDPFFTTKSTGTGLGLAIVQKIIRLHGGQLELDSQMGRGTVAVVTLPGRLPTTEAQSQRGRLHGH